MYTKVWLTLLVYITSSFAEDLGSCFGNKDDNSCEKNRVNILGEYYECKVLQKFEDLPSNLKYEKGNIFLTVGNDKFMYDLESNKMTKKKYRTPSPVKVITHNDIIFTGGNGKVIVSLPEGDENLFLNTFEEMTDDEIDLYDKTNILFILSRYPKENNNKNPGDLYTFNMNNISEEQVDSEKIYTSEQQFSSMVVIPEKNRLLLTTYETQSGKIISISLIPSNPCTTNFRKIDMGKKNSTEVQETKNNSITEILNEVDVKLMQILDKLSDPSKNTINKKDAVYVNLVQKYNNLKNKYDQLQHSLNGNIQSQVSRPVLSNQPAPNFRTPQSVTSQDSSISSVSSFNMPPPIYIHQAPRPPNSYNPYNFSNQERQSVPVDTVLKMFLNLYKQERIYNIKLQNQLNKIYNEKNNTVEPPQIVNPRSA